MRRRPWLLLPLLAALTWPAELAAGAETPAWCASELSTLSDGVCAYDAEAPPASPDTTAAARVRAKPDTLVIFLHTLVKADSNWQWEQQRIVWTAAKTHGFSVLVPRGRRGIGPGRSPDVLAWPTSPKTQEAVEAELVSEWDAAQKEFEQRRGRPFSQVWVFGFSNGAYYATSLAMRDRVHVDGFGVFAGGAGGKYNQILGTKAAHRAPIFVGYGTRDPARADMQGLVSLLKTLGWSFRAHSQPVGHIVTHEQLRRAVHFLAGAT